MEQDERFSVGAALPFCTDDAILANCLLVAGIKETPWSPRNVYSEDILFKAGGGIKDENGQVTRRSRFHGMKPIQAARAAWSEKRPKDRVRGRVEYHFEHTPEINYFVEAYRDQEAKIKAPGENMDAGEAIRAIMHLAAEGDEQGRKMDEREALLRILCVVLKLRIAYVNRWKDVVPVLLILGPGEKSTGVGPRGGRLETFPGGKCVPVNASNELLKKMNLL